ncbi:breast cancer anti-estrogen resistance protein 3 homolog isoform X1 [Latimeria chalumnae]|uniref:breast cancer anti-estrogen resistance protein 3 homolog isoform X1 n=2 Tax=Latimeria chalumnae TaxID=7897 RepID=UPI00313D5B9D
MSLCNDVTYRQSQQRDKKSFRQSFIQKRDKYLNFLKLTNEKGRMESKEKLKKELEEELKLSTEDLRSHAWYHGATPREEAETLVERDGDFLIRDSSSSPGDYVLTCSWGGEALHFKIIRVVLRPKRDFSRVLFQFEQDQFDNVPALVRFHVGNRKPISEKTGAIIFHPTNRTIPLRVIEERLAAKQSTKGQTGSNSTKRLSLNGTLTGDTLDAALLRNKDWSGSHPGNLDIVSQRPCLQSARSDSNLRTGLKQSIKQSEIGSFPAPLSPTFRTGSDPILSPKNSRQTHLPSEGGTALRGSDGQLHSKAPPKPLRTPSIVVTNISGDLIANADTYCELVPRAPPSTKTHINKLRSEEKWRSRIRATDTNFQLLDLESSPLASFSEASEEEEDAFVQPEIETTSSFNPGSFNSILLSPNNKALDQTILRRLKQVFAENDAKTTARHILYVDCQVARITNVSKEQKRKMGADSGLELITLPHGHQLRLDLLERHHLISLGIAVDLLGCTGTASERATVLHKIIQLAIELKESMGDLFAFSAVMKALELPQVTRLELTWRTLRRLHTDSAVAFEKNLKPFLKAMESSKAESAVNSLTFPHILPLIMLMEGVDLFGQTENSCELLLQTLEAARAVVLNTSAYTANAEEKFKDFQPNKELLEAFRTEFAQRLFWGSKGAEVKQEERYNKFDQILTVLSKKLEPEQLVEK